MLRTRPHPASFTGYYASALLPTLVYTVASRTPIHLPHAELIAMAAAALLAWLFSPRRSAPLWTGVAAAAAAKLLHVDTAPVVYAVSAVWLAAFEAWRRSIEYVVWEGGVRIRSGVLRRSERLVSCRAVTDVILVRGLLDRLLGLGSVVVLTASGVGTGFSLRGVGEGVYYARGETRYLVTPSTCIYGVREWRRVMELLERCSAGS